MDIAQLRTNTSKLYLFVAINRTSKFALAQIVDKANRKTAWDFLDAALNALTYKILAILTANVTQFCDYQRNHNTPNSQPIRFDIICTTNGIWHHLTKDAFV